MRPVDPYLALETRFRREFLLAHLTIAMLAAAIFLSFPEIDLGVSAALKAACNARAESEGWCTSNLIGIVRKLFMLFFVVASVAAIVVGVRTLLIEKSFFGLAQARCLFLLATLVVGPGLVANTIFKDQWGRARPHQTVDFGGQSQFTPALVPARECERNCAFVSGEASSIYAPFFALALLFPQFRLSLLVTGIAGGTVAGLIRMSQGAHFLSDVIFAGLFMALTVSVLHILIIGLWRDSRPWHEIAPSWVPALKPHSRTDNAS